MKKEDHRVVNNQRCCAERIAIGHAQRDAQRHGVRPHATIAWVLRKYGHHITVWRTRADGSYGCAVPCVVCRREIERFGLRVHCTTVPLDDASSEWYHGYMDDPAAPTSKPTSRQAHTWRVAERKASAPSMDAT